MTAPDSDLKRLRDEASALNVDGQYAEALSIYDDLVAHATSVAQLHNERAAVLRNMGRIADATAACETALKLDPDYAPARFNLAGLLLTEGRYREGFREYEWRLKIAEAHIPALKLKAPMWDGSHTPDKRLLVVAEQGLGDTVQFVRFLAKARERVGALAIVVQKPLKDLCEGVAGADLVIGSGEPIPAHDLKVSLLSLPHLLRTSLATLPAPAGYLDVTGAVDIAHDGLKAGISWQGNPEGIGDRGRSVPLEALRPLLTVPMAKFFSLQKNVGVDQIAAFPEIDDAVGDCETFADTARVMKSLDLIITTDTAVAHVAGALGRPTWLLLKHAPSWRWLRNRTDSPWYPTMRLFRQASPGDWNSVIDRATTAFTAATSV